MKGCFILKRRITALLIAAALLMALTACGDDGSDDKENVSDSDAMAVSSQEDSDAALIYASKAKLYGTWTFSGVDLEQLTFKKDGTGTYEGIFDKKCTFTYTVSTYHQVYNNNSEKVIALMSVSFSTGESEDITFEFRGDNDEKLVFHNSDYTSGYYGNFNFDEYVKA